jgi:hypothetical protein
VAVSYATFGELSARLGVDYLQEKTPRPVGFDPADPNWDHVETYWAALIEEKSQEIDLYLRRAGYPAPCVESDGTTILPGAAPLLRSWCIALTLGDGQVSNVGEGDPIVAGASRARSQLEALVGGEIRLDAPLAAAIAGGSVYPRVAPTDAELEFIELGNVVALSRAVGDR